MTFDARAGRVLITDSSGATKFDSSGSLFHVTDTISGSISLPQVVSDRDAKQAIVKSHNLGSCLDAATHIIGSFKLTGGGGGTVVLTSAGDGVALPSNGWFCAGGTYMHLISPYDTTTGGSNDAQRHMVHYTFRCLGGVVYLDQVTRVNNTANFFVGAHTINYRLKAGLFT